MKLLNEIAESVAQRTKTASVTTVGQPPAAPATPEKPAAPVPPGAKADESKTAGLKKAWFGKKNTKLELKAKNLDGLFRNPKFNSMSYYKNKDFLKAAYEAFFGEFCKEAGLKPEDITQDLVDSLEDENFHVFAVIGQYHLDRKS